MNKSSLESASYILNSIDDFSIFTSVYFLKNKNIVFENFKEFRALVDKFCGRTIKCLRLDNGVDYVSRHCLRPTRLSLVSLGSDLSLILLNKMVWMKGRIVLWSRWLIVSYKMKTCGLGFGLK